MSKNWFARKHDVVFFYIKDKKYTFHPIEVKEYYSEIYGDKFKPGWEDRKGGKDSKGYFRMAFKDDVWNVPGVFNMSKEYMGYPTQKPEALLEMLIKSTSNEGDIVLDAMMGGGTTLVVANRLKRRWVGIDVSPVACKMSAQRLRKNGVKNVSIITGLITEKELRKLKDFEFQRWACEKLFGRVKDKKSGDMGIDGYTFDMIPIQVKQSDGIGRNVVDNFGWAIERAKKNKGIIVAFSFGSGANEEVARAKIEKKIDIKLITVKELLESHDIKSMLGFK